MTFGLIESIISNTGEIKTLIKKKIHDAREHAQLQWNENPCGAFDLNKNKIDFFDKVEKLRYKQQYWQKNFFDFNSFSGRVLEIGIGLGTDLKQFARAGAQCHGIDITDEHLIQTKNNFNKEGMLVKLKKGDANNLPYSDSFFESVYSFGVIHHIPDIDKVLKEIYRVLKPGGILQIAVYHKYSIHTLSLFLRAFFSGKIFKIGIKGVLSTIELGADGVKIKPYVKLYSKYELRGILLKHNFKINKNGIKQVNYDNRHKLNFLRRFENYIGWYVCYCCTK